LRRQGKKFAHEEPDRYTDRLVDQAEKKLEEDSADPRANLETQEDIERDIMEMQEFMEATEGVSGRITISG
jgi:hypothetical protein